MMKRRKTAAIHPEKILAQTMLLRVADDGADDRLSSIKCP
jgi:hypothetical protein